MEEKKNEFWNQLGEVIQKISTLEAHWIGHVGCENEDVEEYIGVYGIGEKKEDSKRIVNMTTARGLMVVCFTKRISRKITYSSGGNNSQLDYNLCRRQMLKQVVDCKVISGKVVAK